MRKNARSESRRVVRTVVREPEADEFGSGVSPLRVVPPASMPSVGARRSTRVFVRKNAAKVAPDGDPGEARVLRSGKRLRLSKPVGDEPGGGGVGDAYEWMGFFGSSGDAEDTGWWKGKKEGEMAKCRCRAKEGPKRLRGSVTADKELPKNVLNEDSATASLDAKAFRIVYSRKRRRSHSHGSDSLYSQSWMIKHSRGSCSLSSMLGDKDTEDRRYGIAFVRKPRTKKPKLSSLVTAFTDKGLGITETAWSFAQKIGISERYPWFGSTGNVVLVALVQSACSESSYRFACFLASTLAELMKKNVSLPECAAFVSSRSAGSSFSLHGIHFLPVRHWESDFSHRIAMSDVGFCIIFEARLSVPLVSVNFSSLPFLFKSWHLSIFSGSLYLPSGIARYQRQWLTCTYAEVSVEERRLYDSHICAETVPSEIEIISSETPAAKEIDVARDSCISPAKEVSKFVGASGLSVRNTAVISGIKFQKRRKKRSFLRSVRVPRRSLLKSRRNSLLDAQSGILRADMRVKIHPIRECCEFEAVHEKPVDSHLGEDSTEVCALPSRMSPNQKRSMTKNSFRVKEPKSEFAEAKQNTDMLGCTANLLVTESDRCWRQEGVKVTLELSSSNEWCLAVKFTDATRFLHRAQEMKPSSSNRYTHAIMWTSESGWKLEFYDKNDWNAFKEMHKECYERNVSEVSVRIIPVPGVQEVPGYDENFTSSFTRPDSYIHMVNDEVDRVLTREDACYDMDSGDEEWLEHLNYRMPNADVDSSNFISKDCFERIISTFEKAAYSHPDDVTDQKKAANLCSQFGKRDMIAAIFDYWMKKRKQKHLALIKVFQGQPTRKRQTIQKPLLRKKRSFKRQGSHAGRVKPNIFFEAAAKQDAEHRLQAAEAAASRAVDIAIRLRSRAQVLMMNADLATYKSVMALRFAESIRESEALDLSTAILG